MLKKINLVLIILFLGFSSSSFCQNGLNFDGANDWVSTAQNGIAGTASRTVECWIKTSFNGTQGVLVDWGSTAANGNRFTFNVLNGLLRIEVAGNGLNSTTSVSDGTWHHVAVTYNNANAAGTKAKLYIDGVLNASADFTVTVNTLTTNTIRIGQRVDGINFYNGSIDEVRIWNVERTAAQILADKGKQYCDVPTGLISYFKFNQGTAGGTNTGLTTITNSASSTNSGTLNGFALTGTSSNFVTGASLILTGYSSGSTTVNACSTYTSPSGNYVYTTTGIYQDTIHNVGACDSIVTINLTIAPSPVTGLAASAITTSSATLSWNAGTVAVGYEYVLNQTLANPAGAGTTIATTSYPASGLTASTLYYMHVRSSCGTTFSAWSTVSFTTLCTSPTLTSKKDSFNCGPGPVTLEATTSAGGNLKWYTAAAGGVNVGNGNVFVTPSLTATTNFYVETVKLTSLGQVGRNDYTGISQVTPNMTGQGIQFNALTDINLDSVSLWVVNDTGHIIVRLLNAANTVLRTDTFAFSTTGTSATSRVKIYLPVNYTIPSGNNYKLLALSGTTVTLSREQTVNPPFTNYAIANTISMVSSWVNGAVNNANYYYFYNFYVSSGCASARQMAVAAIRPIPVVSLGNDTTICPGVSYTFNAGNAGASYLWSPNGETSQTITTNAAGQYIANVTVNGCSKRDTILVTPGIAPVNNLPDITNLCVGSVATLNAGNTGFTYLWTPGGATTQTITTNTGGTYSVEVKSIHGCKITSSSNVIIRPLPVANLGNDTSICEGATILLDAGNSGYTYVWNTGATSQTVNASDSGTYLVTTTTPYSCFLVEDKHIAFLPSPRTEGFNFIPKFYEEMGKVSFSPLNPTDVNSYEWDFGDNSPLVTQMNPTHIYNASRDYNVTLKVYNDCTDFSISQVINVDLPTGFVTINKNDIDLSVYPNPAKQTLMINNKSQDYKMEDIMVLNAVGSVVYHQKASSSQSHEIAVDGFANGLYHVRILTNKGFVNKQFQVLK